MPRRLVFIPDSRSLGRAVKAGWLALFLFLSAACGLRAQDTAPAPGFRSRALTVPGAGRPFLQILPASSTGVAFTNFVSEEKGLENSLRGSGAGVAAGDVDGDGLCDLYFCGMENDNALFRNLGNWRFENITGLAGVACVGDWSSGAVLADVDGDRDLDLLVNSLGGGTRLFLNDGKARFTEAAEAGLARRFGATSGALADIDGNGTLDLYVCNYAASKIEDRPNARFDTKRVDGRTIITAIDGVPTSSPELTNRYFVDEQRIVRERGEPDILYLNDGRGTFRPVSWTDGTFLDEQGRPLAQPPYDFGLTVMFRDMNGDGAPDLYICNDLFPPDRIWVNDGRGRFRAMSNLAVRNTSRFSMGIDFADINRDGLDDFFVVDMLSRGHLNRKVQTVGVLPILLPPGLIDNRPQYKKNTLFLGRADGTYAEIAQLAGLEATEWSWTPAFLDVDLDGYEDVLVTTGHERDSLHADAVGAILRERGRRKLTDEEQGQLKKRLYPPLRTSTQAFRNRGDLTFEDKARDWGFDYVGISQGLCLADLDHDGDLDVVVTTLNDAALLYRNEGVAPRVAVRLQGRAPNTRGIGAKIKLLGGVVPAQSQEMICGGRYLSADDTIRTFAAGRSAGGMALEVTWRNGSLSVVKDVQPNRLYEIDETGAGEVGSRASRVERMTNSPGARPLFADFSHLLSHTNIDEPYNEFERQPLLGRRLSQLGPGVSWFDVDEDGWDDAILGAGYGGHLAVYRNDGRGGFQRLDKPVLHEPLKRDLTTILGWSRSDGRRVLLAGSSNYEDGAPQGACVREFDLDQAAPLDRLPAWECSTGPLALADYDGDGILDLFVGGRAMPGRYPEEPFSIFLRGTGTNFSVAREPTKAIAAAGLVSGAVFSDLDGDGDVDLVLACDWGPIRIYRNEQGVFSAWDWRVRLDAASSNSPLTTLPALTGWWNGVTTGDFDGDGRLDLVAGNWGRNTKFQSHRAQPQRLFFGDWLGNGVLYTMEAYFDRELNKVVPWTSVQVARAMPPLLERFPTHESFGRASVAEILGDRMAATKVLEAAWLDTTVFLNRGDHFEVKSLPVEAQFAPVFGVSVGDFDGDGAEDLFLAQNFFATDGDSPRCDAGRGLVLAGDGRGGFRPLTGEASGVKVYGDQRGCALSDFDGDGRVDLVVSQNGAETKLYRNVEGRPGLRVRLLGPPGNPAAVGALTRLSVGGRAGPMREIHAGAGYWSQDSAVQVLCAINPGKAPLQIEVRWPGGKRTSSDVPAGAKEITVDALGIVKTIR